MHTSEFKESSKPLLRPDQVQESLREIKRLGGMIDESKGNEYISNLIQDKKQVRQMLKNITADLESQRPTPYGQTDLDSAVKREAFLRGKFTEGMLTAAEMRKAPPGALPKNTAWEKRNSLIITEWKNIRRRLHVSGDLKNLDLMDSYGVSNIEMYRPTGGSQEGNMHNAQIPGKEFYMDYLPTSVVFTEDELATIKEFEPGLSDKLASMSSQARLGVKELLPFMVKEEKEKILCAHEVFVHDISQGGCKREVENKDDLCWQHQKKDLPIDQEQ